jgi:hypothetical protein
MGLEVYMRHQIFGGFWKNLNFIFLGTP